MSVDDFFPAGITTAQVVLAILSFVVGWVASHFARTGVLKLALRTPGITDSVAHLAARITQYMLLLVGIGIGLAFLGANIQPLLAMTAIATVVLVLVLRGVADNFAAGVLIQSRQSLRLGEEICVDGPDGPVRGVVVELTGRSVILSSSDGLTVHVPNAGLLSAVLINDSRHGSRRSMIQVRIARTSAHDLSDVITLLTETTASVEGVHSREHVSVLVQSVSPNRWMLAVRFWHHPLHRSSVASAAVIRLSAALESADLDAVITSDPGGPPLVAADPL